MVSLPCNPVGCQSLWPFVLLKLQLQGFQMEEMVDL